MRIQPEEIHCPCHSHQAKNCEPDHAAQRLKCFQQDLDDIAISIIQVMRICGIMPWVASRAKPVITRCFQHYDEVRYRIDRVPRKRFSKEDFIHGMAVIVKMTRMEGQLAYSIAKRAFRAYYHGTARGGKHIKALTRRMHHRQECLWLHAAQRTAEVYAVYAGLMYSEQLQYAKRIECEYKSLYDVLKKRIIFEEKPVCSCRQARKAPKLKPSNIDNPMDVWQPTSGTTIITTEVLFMKENLYQSGSKPSMNIHVEQISVQVSKGSDHTSRQTSRTKNSSKQSNTTQNSSMPSSKTEVDVEVVTKFVSRRKTTKCKCPKMQCEQEFGTIMPQLTAECSQGPYICRWLPYEEEFPEHCVPYPPIEEICPPCSDNIPCDPECTCTCEYCHCPPAYGESGEEEHHGEKLSATGIEDHDTEFCFVAPLRDWPRAERKEEEEEAEGEEEAQEPADAPFKCRCTCKYKQRAFPHLFTYVAPFKDKPPPPPPEPAVEKEERPCKPLKESVPPLGVSMEGYMLWTTPTPPPSEGRMPRIEVRSNPPKQPQQMKVEVKVKNQHYNGTILAKKTANLSPKPNAVPPTKQNVAIKTSAPTKAITKPTPPKPLPPVKPAAAPRPAPPMPTTPVLRPPPAQAAQAARPAPAPAAPPAAQPVNRSQPQEPEPDLTKEDILDIIGLR